MARDELYGVFLRAECSGKRALLVPGPIGSGKTRAVGLLAQTLRERGYAVAGVLSPRVLVGAETVGYLVQDLCTGKSLPLCAASSDRAVLASLFPGNEPNGEVFRFRRFFFFPKSLAFANAALEKAAREAEVIVVDEVGPLELSGEGLAPGLGACLKSPAVLILTVRPHLLLEVQRLLGLREPEILRLP